MEVILACINCNKSWIDLEHYMLEAADRNGHCCDDHAHFWVHPHLEEEE